jgi:UDP-N-acetylglucosamine transferase subunit ALG13
LGNGPKINTYSNVNVHILLAPLDWGLGHTTRCIPIIRELIRLNCRVTLAATGMHANLLQQEFPNLELVPLAGYGLHYGRNSRSTMWKIFFQIPKILISIKRENRWLTTFLRKNRIDLVISDSRFGFYHDAVRSIFITHQLNIKTPFGKLAERILRRLNYGYINRFDACWVPDHKEQPNLAGDLSHPPQLPQVPVEYIGPLSRFEEHPDVPAETFDLLIILSGPEPQRSILEDIMLTELAGYKGKAAMVRGLPGHNHRKPATTARVFDHLPAHELSSLIAGSALVISRAGYTTVMDLVKLKKKAVLIPTPGQAEQEYLGHHLMQQHRFLCMQQQGFSLSGAIAKADAFDYKFFDKGEIFVEVIREAISGIRNTSSTHHTNVPALPSP